ncbi:MAG: hypothetical protein LBS42_05090, partial [Tannerella sp.]|nr:hypothetical protein [Tannerella sp.]
MKRIKNTLAAVLLTALCSGHAFADGTFNINAGTGTGNGYTWSSPTLTITANGTYIINGSGIATANRIMVNSNLTNVNIILNNVNINVSGCAFDMSGAKVNLILSGTNTLKSGSGAGLRVPFGAELVINKETDDVTDKLTATGGGGGAGIGCSSGDNGGKITIKGGTVTAKGGSNGAGIGSGEYAGAPGSNSGIIIIDGGIITATGGSYSAGIGGGRNGLTVNIAINGGHVTATSAYGGAGIGGGDIGAISDLDDNSAINIKITGGTVTANGGGYGAGIGGGLEGSGGNITISGGSVNATGGSSGAGIGGGGYYQTSIGGSGGNITISGGTVTATAGNNGAAIGGGSNNIDNGTVKITGGSVKMNNHDGPQPQNGANVSVYLNTLTIAPAIGDEVAVTASNIPGGYGLTDVKTRDGSKVYFYLPETIGDEKLQLKANNINYKNTYQRQANNGNNKILYEHDLVVSGGTPGTDYQWVNNVLTFKQAGSMYTVTMSGATVPTTTERITVNNDSGDTYNITLDGVSIDVSATSGACAFDMTGAKVKLTLTGTNTLTSGDNSAGLQAPDGATLEITEASLGTLTATGGTLGAGIGGGDHGKGGNIAINGGTVTANGGYGGAAIGGGDFGAGGNITISGGAVTANGGSWGAAIGGGGGSNGGSVGGNITISGGTVTATSGGYGAGIGGGDRSAGGDITISGGTVEANGGSGGAGIGGGEGGAGGTVTITGGSVKMNNHDGPQPKNSIGSTGANVYLNTLTIGDPAVGNNVAVTAGNINFVACDPTPNAANGVYGIKDVKTDADGKVYFYLPVTATTETEPTALIAGSNNYSEEFIHSATNHSDEATLTVKNYGVALNHAEQSPTPYTFAALGYGAVPTALTVKALNMG